MSHQDNQNFDDLSKEVLIRDLESLLHFLINNLPYPLSLTTTLCSISSFCEESFNELYDQSVVARGENIPELLFIVCTLNSYWHECKFEHEVFRFIVA